MANCKICGAVLDALHMGDIEPDMCIECESKAIDSLELLPEEPLVLWKR